MIEYRKVMNRSLSVIACQHWEKGEREEILKICDGVFSAEPMFIFRSGQGVAVHYSWSDRKQDPERLVEFFNVHPEAFDKIRTEYLQLCAEIEAMKLKQDASLQAMFNLLVAMWPGLTLCTMLGKWEGSPLNEDVRRGCFELRESTDEVFYDADAVIEKTVAMMVGSDRVADAEFLTIDEIVSGVYPNQTIVDQRKKGFVYFKGELSTPESISDFVRPLGIEIAKEDVNEADELKGQSASVGVVTGTVKIVFEKSQMGKVQKGDILVASMTTPDFMSAIRLASALITDEGGITCHAAIIAREMKKPCVIGTKIATRVLRDGDIVEVDAMNGVVRKIM